MDRTAPAASPEARPRLGAERSPRRDLIHGVVLVFPWAGLVWLWWNLLRHDTSALGLVGQVVVVGVAVTFVVTLVWIAHNLAIARRKGPRRGLPATELVYEHDWTGRPVRAAWDEVLAARVVIVSASDGVKRFIADPATPPGWQVTGPPREGATDPDAADPQSHVADDPVKVAP